MGMPHFTREICRSIDVKNTLPEATANPCLAFFPYTLQTQSEPISLLAHKLPPLRERVGVRG